MKKTNQKNFAIKKYKYRSNNEVKFCEIEKFDVIWSGIEVGATEIDRTGKKSAEKREREGKRTIA